MNAHWRTLLGSLLLGLGAAPMPARDVTLGIVAPPSQTDSASLIRGAQLACDDSNADGGGAVHLEIRSENGQWGSAGNDAVVLVCDRHVDGIITPSDGADTHLILQVSGRTRVPVASVCADSSIGEAGVPWALCVVPSTAQQVKSLFTALRQPSGAPLTWCAVVPSGRPGRVARRDIENAARHTSTPVSQFVELPSPAAPREAIVRSIINAAPGGVLLWVAPNQAGPLAAALRTAGYSGQLAGASSLRSPAFAATAGAVANDVLVARPCADPGEAKRAAAFRAAYRARHDVDPDFSAATGYDAAKVLITTLRGSEPKDAYRHFPPAAPIVGVTGQLRFDSSGSRTAVLEVVSVTAE